MGRVRIMPDVNVIVDKFLKWIVDIMVIVIVALFFSIYMCEKKPIVGSSMSPALKNEEKVLIDKMIYELTSPKRYDVVVFENEDADKVYMKRILGLPGETIQVKEGRLYIDGKQSSYNKDMEDIVNPGIAKYEITLASDEYFVMGDNWNFSEDSRSETIGKVNKKWIQGKVWFRVAPFQNIGFIFYKK